MLENTPAPAVSAGRHAAMAAIGRCLAGMYCEYVRSPIPEQLKLLVTKIDASKHPRDPQAARELNHE